MPKHEFYAIVPAAGRSRRMGEPKLLLPWPVVGRENDGRVIDSVLSAWTSSTVVRTVVVARRDDVVLQNACRGWPVDVVTPDDDPADMKESIQVGLRHLAKQFQPSPTDRCFIAPADLPTLSSQIVNALAEAACFTSATVVPKYGDKEGHPIVMSWADADEIFQLPPEHGVDKIVERNSKTHVRFDADQIVSDIDTRERYDSLLERVRAK